MNAQLDLFLSPFGVFSRCFLGWSALFKNMWKVKSSCWVFVQQMESVMGFNQIFQISVHCLTVSHVKKLSVVSQPNLNLLALVAITELFHEIHYIYRYQCFITIWCLLISSVCLMVWFCAWSYSIKIELSSPSQGCCCHKVARVTAAVRSCK